MSSADRIPFILDEQYQSPDLNTLQNLWSRWLTDELYLSSKQDMPALNSAQMRIADNLALVLGGLETRASGANVQVQLGAIVQLSPVAPATDDPITQSTIAFNLAAQVVAMPAPGADTWYLLQAEAADDDDPTVSVPIWNGSAFVSTPGQVKRVRRVIAFSLKAGSSTNIPGPDTNQVPIAGVFRPAGGGAVGNAHIVDLRPMRPYGRGEAHDFKNLRWSTATFSAPTGFFLSAKVESTDGELSYQAEEGSALVSLDLTTATFKETGSPAIAANEWWYLYLCPVVLGGYSFVRPAHLYSGAVGQGMLVFSKTPPSSTWRRSNSVALTYPSPFTGHTCPAGRGVLVAMLKRNGANTSWKPMACLGDHVQTGGALGTWILLAGSAPPQPLFTTVGGNGDMLPAGALAFDVQVVADSAGGGPATVTVRDPSGLLQLYEQLMVTNQIDDSVVFHDVDLTRGQSYRLHATGGAGNLAAYLHGFRF